MSPVINSLCLCQVIEREWFIRLQLYGCIVVINLCISRLPFSSKCLTILVLIFEHLMVDFGFKNIIYKSALESLEFITTMNISKSYSFLTSGELVALG